ncbi:MAG: UMP kinase [Candidatus Bilamarchaeaceae archaeon]
MTVVLSVGGSCVNPDGKPDVGFIKALCAVIRKSGERFGVLVGGGKTARDYAEATRTLGGSEFDADEIAIMSTRQNAMLFLQGLKDIAYPAVLTDFTNAKKAFTSARIVVMGGTIPGITTDTDAVLLAESIGAKRLVNISSISGIYESDPRKNPNAKKFSALGYEQLVALAMEADKRKAGTNFVFDVLACKLIARSKIETHFVGKDVLEIERAINGKKHNGTIVS